MSLDDLPAFGASEHPGCAHRYGKALSAGSRQLRDRALQAGECVHKNTREAQTKLQEQSRTARSRSQEQVRTTVARAQGLRDEVGKRVEPVVVKVQAQLGEIPERVVQAMEPVAARVRELAGTAA